MRGVLIIEIDDTDYEADYFDICFIKLFVSETQTIYCNAGTCFAACSSCDRNLVWVHWVDVKYCKQNIAISDSFPPLG